MNNLFIVEALRWGDRENHSYVVGVFDSLHDACEACVVEELWRGGKYECVINEGIKNKGDIQAQIEELRSDFVSADFDIELKRRVDRYIEVWEIKND